MICYSVIDSSWKSTEYNDFYGLNSWFKLDQGFATRDFQLTARNGRLQRSLSPSPPMRLAVVLARPGKTILIVASAEMARTKMKEDETFVNDW